MEPFQLSFEIPKSNHKIVHGKEVLFIGSCFSDEIANKAKYVGLKVDSNPFGTVFHPTALSRFIKESLDSINPSERIIQRDDLFFSWDANSSIYAMSEVELVLKLQNIRKIWALKIKNADFLFVTFGTAWSYKIKEFNEPLANCHKLPGTLFTKELTEQEEMLKEWKETIEILRKINPELKIVFTVSPVRHSKDGLIENNRSKAILLDVIRKLEEQTNCSYFPSYEIILDELRDYRFFKIDRVHPNDEAVSYVWDRFSEVYFSNETIKLNKEVEKLHLAENHKPLFPESTESKIHLSKTLEKRKQLLEMYPMVKLD